MSGSVAISITVPPIGSAQSHNKRPTVLIYPTGKFFNLQVCDIILLKKILIIVPPETVVIPIISCILGFPLLALLVICCLRRRAKLAREQERRRNYDNNHGTFSIVRFSPMHYLGN